MPDRSSSIEHVVERKSRRLQLTESLQDYFALNPKAYKRSDDTGNRPTTTIAVDDSERSNLSSTKGTNNNSNSSSLDETFHEQRIIPEERRRCRDVSSSGSLDTTFHAERSLREGRATPTLSSSSRRRVVRWMTDMDPSDGTIE